MTVGLRGWATSPLEMAASHRLASAMQDLLAFDVAIKQGYPSPELAADQLLIGLATEGKTGSR